jgi:transposase
MKTLETVLMKREELRRELDFIESHRIVVPSPFAENFQKLNIEEKREYGRAIRVIKHLKIQINALTYVINYDSKLEDVTEETEMRHT